jgi:hypothetical protein
LAGFAVVNGTLLTFPVGGEEKSFTTSQAVFIIALLAKRAIINKANGIASSLIGVDNFSIKTISTIKISTIIYNNIAIGIIQGTGDTFFGPPLEDA